MNLMNALVCFVHLVVIWLICDGVSFVFHKATKHERKKYLAGAFAMAFCALYLALGYFLAHHVTVEKYEFESSKIKYDVRIVQITDAHVGSTFHADRFCEYIEEINTLSPDAVVITGDFVDDDTSRDDMTGACDALGKLSTKSGVYFVYGNHDRGYYREESKGWGNVEFEERLLQNGVVILKDEAVLIDDSYYIVGRRDRSEENRGGRMSAEELTESLDRSKYIIMLDHQPYDFDSEARSGADLVLCGHTHGGQFIPINHVGEWIGENCLRYGHERRGDTDFIVSSGISNWTFKFKTGCHSEYVVADIKSK